MFDCPDCSDIKHLQTTIAFGPISSVHEKTKGTKISCSFPLTFNHTFISACLHSGKQSGGLFRGISGVPKTPKFGLQYKQL